MNFILLFRSVFLLALIHFTNGWTVLKEPAHESENDGRFLNILSENDHPVEFFPVGTEFDAKTETSISSNTQSISSLTSRTRHGKIPAIHKSENENSLGLEDAKIANVKSVEKSIGFETPIVGKNPEELVVKDIVIINSINMSRISNATNSSSSDQKLAPEPEMVFEYSQPVEFNIASFLESLKGDDPIILKPINLLRKISPLIEMKQRICIPCLAAQQSSSSSSRHALPNTFGTFEDYVPEANEEQPIDFHSSELERRRKNFQRISQLLPDHRSLPTLQQFLHEDNTNQHYVSHPPGKSERSFLSSLFALWPFGSKATDISAQVNAPQSLEQQQTLAQASREDEAIILKPAAAFADTIIPNDVQGKEEAEVPMPMPAAFHSLPKPFTSFIPAPTEPKPNLSLNGLFDSSSTVGNTIEEIREEINKQNTVKLEPTSMIIPIINENLRRINGSSKTMNLLGNFPNLSQSSNYLAMAAEANNNNIPHLAGIDPRHMFRSMISSSEDLMTGYGHELPIQVTANPHPAQFQQQQQPCPFLKNYRKK